MKMFGTPKENFFSSKARLNFEVYGQGDKITPEAGIKRLLCHFTTHIPDLGTQITDFGSDYAQHLRNNRQRLSTP